MTGDGSSRTLHLSFEYSPPLICDQVHTGLILILCHQSLTALWELSGNGLKRSQSLASKANLGISLRQSD